MSALHADHLICVAFGEVFCDLWWSKSCFTALELIWRMKLLSILSGVYLKLSEGMTDYRWNSFRLIIWANAKKQLFETLHISTDKVLGGVGLMRTDVGHTQRCTDLELFHCLLDIGLSWLGYWETCFLACLLQRDLSGFVTISHSNFPPYARLFV